MEDIDSRDRQTDREAGRQAGRHTKKKQNTSIKAKAHMRVAE